MITCTDLSLLITAIANFLGTVAALIETRKRQ